jgi:hypothetical protein
MILSPFVLMAIGCTLESKVIAESIAREANQYAGMAGGAKSQIA